MKKISYLSWASEYAEKNGVPKTEEEKLKAKQAWENVQAMHAALSSEKIESRASDDQTSSPDVPITNNKWGEINKRGGNTIMGFVVLCLIGYGVVSCVQIKREEANRTPAQVAADNAKARQIEIGEKYKDLRMNAEEVLRNYLLSSGKGMCDSLENVAWKSVRYGTAVYQYAKREPSITGAYAVDCVYYLNGDRLVKSETYWFQVTMQKSSGEREGKILLENPVGINENLRYTKFLDAT